MALVSLWKISRTPGSPGVGGIPRLALNQRLCLAELMFLRKGQLNSRYTLWVTAWPLLFCAHPAGHGIVEETVEPS
jgi:hypothetical protein